MIKVRELVDSAHTLPNVELVTRKSQQWDHMTRDQMSIMYEGENVGKCDIVSEMGIPEPFSHFDGIEIEEDLRGRGIGLAAYVLAIEMSHSRGLPFGTQNWGKKLGAKKIWELLAVRGVAEIIEPFKPSEVHKGQFEGKVRAPLER